MNEEFAIQLRMILNESSIAEVKRQVGEVTKSIDKSVKSTVLDVGNTKTVQIFDMQEPIRYTAQLKYLEEKIADIKVALSSTSISSQDSTLLNYQLEKTINQYNKIIEKQKESNNEAKKAKEEAKNTKNENDGLEKNIKNILLGLIGVRSVYSTIRKAMSSYLSQNEELQNKINASYYALGSLFAPVLEYIVNLFVKLVSFINAFARALGFAGINMSKYGAAAGKAAKQQKQLAGFDEINNLNTSDSSGTGFSNPFSTDVLGDKFKDFFKMIQDNAEAIKLIGIGAMFGIGVALLFTGHPGLGLGMIVASGVLGYKYLNENWNTIIEKVGGTANAIALIAAGFVAGLGLVFLFSGNIATGLGLLLTGFSIAAVAIDWNSVPNKLKEVLGSIVNVIASSWLFLTAIGILLMFINPGLGLAVVAAAIASKYAAKKMNTSYMPNTTEKMLDDTGDVALSGMMDIENTFGDGWNSINLLSGFSWEKIKSTVITKWNNIKNSASEKFDNIKATISTKWENMKIDASNKWDNIKTTISTKWDNIKTNVSTKADNLKTTISTKWEEVKSVTSTKWDNIKTTVTNALEAAKTTIANSKLKNTMETAWTSAVGIFDSIAGKIKIDFGLPSPASVESTINSRYGGTISVGIDYPKLQWSSSEYRFTESGRGYVASSTPVTKYGNKQFVTVEYGLGTNYVPNDQLAYLHKGEAVIPAEYNQTQGNPYIDGNGETNNLLRELINVVDSKEFKAYISQNEVGKASINYINNQSRILGGSVI